MRVAVVGGGAIGGFLAAELSAGGAEVTLVVRTGGPRPGAPLEARRLDGRVLRAADSLVVGDLGEVGSVLARADVCVVAVKSYSTDEVAEDLARALPSDVPVVSFQNGLRNTTRLRAHLGARAIGGMVGFNVRVDDDGRRLQTSVGRLAAGLPEAARLDPLRELQAVFERAGERLELRRDVERLQAGKLLLNLNNGVCAATGLSIGDSLRDRDGRLLFAGCVREGMRWMRASGLRPARVALVPPRALAHVLALPDWMLHPLLPALSGVQASARSSTLQDLDAGRATEIADLNGYVVELASRHGGRAPYNEAVTATVHEHEAAVAALCAPRFPTPRELRRRVDSAP